MRHLALEDFEHDGERMDSLYRVVNVAARRANQLNKIERPFMAASSPKPVIQALEEILEGKVWYRTGSEEDDEYDVG